MSDDPVAIRSYAVRRVNPFLGVLQIIETDAGRAISANGIVWDIEVRAERPAGWGHLNRHKPRPAYYRYGLWSRHDGLVSRPLAPHLETDPLTHQCHQLIECIEQRMDDLPFDLIDNHELWLFDPRCEQPLALLASVVAEAARPSPEPRHWSASIGAQGVPSQRRFPLADALEQQVRQMAGFNIQKRWIIRQADGSGLQETGGVSMPAQLFPRYLITEHWPDEEQQQRAADYIKWIAPALLTLQDLCKDERRAMENSLHVQAVSVEHHWHLYPDIIDNRCLNAAIVQCRLQKANATGEESHA